MIYIFVKTYLDVMWHLPSSHHLTRIHCIFKIINYLLSVFCHSFYSYLLDNPSIVRNKSVLDIGSGCGASSIASIMCGATRVLANDIDPGM